LKLILGVFHLKRALSAFHEYFLKCIRFEDTLSGPNWFALSISEYSLRHRRFRRGMLSPRSSRVAIEHLVAFVQGIRATWYSDIWGRITSFIDTFFTCPDLTKMDRRVRSGKSDSGP